MNDLISRRKAFEYFVTLWECIGTIIDRDEWEDVCMTTANEIPSAQQWIPCSERLPEALQEVLVTSTHGHVYTSRIVHGDFEYGGNVLAWMPLPEPYKGEES